MDTTKRAVAIIDDHFLVRQGLEGMVNAVDGLTVVWSGASPRDLLDNGPSVDLLLLDLDLSHGIVSSEDVTEFVERDVRVLVISAMAKPEVVRRLAALGVAGFVTKQDSHATVLEAIDTVLGGDPYTTPELAAILAATPDGPALSEQEARVLALYASGLKIAAVARRLEISPHTVQEYLKRIRQKFAAGGRPAHSKSDLYREALRTGLINPVEPGEAK